ncbi:hypothetical protein HA50_27255 [Pantoea cypripedii]|uniref:Conjugation system SOS inhibitor PsiB n=1 Tax=Pantoea cypripedii TaxID=55209 RepID=A0A1X1EN27_PANCY|nr:hypothetical protein HA50_27255 [Pantoea cypripedii]
MLTDNACRPALRGGSKEMIVHKIITADAIRSMTPFDFEDYHAGGLDMRWKLTCSVMQDLRTPYGWNISSEYSDELGGIFPVQVRFTPPHGRFDIALNSPGNLNPVWLLSLINGGQLPFIHPVAVYDPVMINHITGRAARLDEEFGSLSDIVRTLMGESIAGNVPLMYLPGLRMRSCFPFRVHR